MYATRLKSVLILLGLGAAVLLVFLFRLQVLQGDRYRQAAEERLESSPGFHPTIRGTIYDRHGVALAQDTGAFDVAVYFPFLEMKEEFVARQARAWGVAEAEVRLRVERMWQELARLTAVPPEELARRTDVIRRRVEVLRRMMVEAYGRRIPVQEENFDVRRPVDRQGKNSIPHTLVHDVDLNAVAVIGSRPEQFPGLVLLPTRKREYPLGGTAPHVIGRLGEVTQEELDGSLGAKYPPGHPKSYLPGDVVGRGGVEALSEDLLRGSLGMYRQGIEGDFLEDIPPKPGRDVHLTLDIALQADVEAILDRGAGRRAVGAAVVLDCTTGEVLVLVSAPRYDVRQFEADYPDLLRDPAKPLFHRAVAGQYPLGSVFKAVTSTAALHECVLAPHTPLTCNGILDPAHPNRFRCHIYPSGHGTIELRTAIKKSCNVFFYQVGMLLGRGEGLTAARDRLVEWAGRMGLGQPTGIGLPGEAGGAIHVGDPRNLAVGQGELLVTPIQVAQLYGLVATDGRMPPLRLVRELAPSPDAGRPGLDLNPKYMAVIRDAFAAVVNEEGGTGYNYVRSPEVRIAGKTGTAQAGRGEDHAWFAGFAPAENPKIAFAVIIEHGGHGGETAGPIARQIVETCKTYGYLDDRPAGNPRPVPTSSPTDAPVRKPVG